MSKHTQEQLLRFVRLFVLALVPQLVAVGHWDRSAVISVVVAAGETAYRQWRKTATIPLP